MFERAVLEEHRRDHVTEREKRHRRGHHEEGDLAQSRVEALSKIAGDLCLAA